jgi:hypothetical protein
MTSRYDNRKVGVNRTEQYEEIINAKKTNFLRQYTSPAIIHPSIEQLSTIETIKHVWKLGDKYYKLANKHYGDSKLWWVIALFNLRPTEAHIDLGDIVEIPVPLERVLHIYGY